MQINILIEVEENLKNGRKRHGKKRVREERKTRRYGHMPKEFGPRILKCRMEKKKKSFYLLVKQSTSLEEQKKKCLIVSLQIPKEKKGCSRIPVPYAW